MRGLPEKYKFAFSIVDDTDDANLQNIRPVYNFLNDLGIYITKTIWPMACPEGSKLFFAGTTMADAEYLSYVKVLQQWGFEIASHNATMETSKRERTEAGFEYMDKQFGIQNWLHCNHGNNMENIYWGPNRFSMPMYKLLAKSVFYRGRSYHGENKNSDYFWGDICQQKVKYVRNFTFSELNLFKISDNPVYRLKQTPYVKNWFITSDAPDVNIFNKLVNQGKLEKLIAERGICLLSTHLGKGFYMGGTLNARFKKTMEYIADAGGWYVPASTLLDHINNYCQQEPLSRLQRIKLETKFINQSMPAAFQCCWK